jgi:Rieske 2Fe-2S family protein
MSRIATLTRDDYCAESVFATERARIFHRGWFYACHIDALPPGHRRVVDVVGESVILSRDVDGSVHAHANVCRHRGSQLCDPSPDGTAEKGAIRCPYHAWTYGLDGSLRATPRVDDADLDRSQLGLWSHHADTWNGLVFVSLAPRPVPLSGWLSEHTPWLAEFEELALDTLVIGARTEAVVRANWKIILENYEECLHCSVVHPELVDLIPVYRTGNVLDPDREDEGVELADGGNSFTLDGTSTLSLLPGMRPEHANLYRGAGVFPNVMLDITGTSASLTALFPVDAATTVVVAEYLFNRDDAASPDFDPSAIIEFNELVGTQDFDVCERVQRGVASASFTSGRLTEKDKLVADFVAQYRTILAAAP